MNRATASIAYPTDTPKRLTITVQQAAGLLGLSVPTIWTLLSEGRIESIALNRRRLILWESVVKLVESCRGVRGDARRNGTVPAFGATNGKKKEEDDLSTSVADLALSSRPQTVLLNNGVRTLRDLIAKTDAELLKLPNLGHVSLREITAMLAERGLHLGTESQ